VGSGVDEGIEGESVGRCFCFAFLFLRCLRVLRRVGAGVRNVLRLPWIERGRTPSKGEGKGGNERDSVCVREREREKRAVGQKAHGGVEKESSLTIQNVDEDNDNPTAITSRTRGNNLLRLPS